MKWISLFCTLFLLVTACNSKVVQLEELQGKWKMDTNVLVFEKDTVRFLNEKQACKYEIQNDTLLYIYYEMPGDSVVRVTEFGIRKLNRHTLQIDNGTEKQFIYQKVD